MRNYNNDFLYQFIKTYDVVNEDVCKSCIKTINKNKDWIQHTFYNESLKKSHTRSGSKELSVLHYDQASGDEKKIIILGSLNNNYEGGEFIMFDKKEYKIKAGQVLIFPSFFFFPHRVEPVTKGTRYTYISWAY